MKKVRLVFTLFLLGFFSNRFFALDGPLKGLELIDFSVIQNAAKVDIKWKTSIETGGPYFTIEKSKDGKVFTKIVDIPAIESGTVYSDYFETDYQPYEGISYYRIKQTDEAGNFRYSQTITCKWKEKNEKVLVAQVTAEPLDAATHRESLLVLRDASGNDSFVKAEIRKEQVIIPRHAEVSGGTYRIIGASSEEAFQQKIMIK